MKQRSFQYLGSILPVVLLALAVPACSEDVGSLSDPSTLEPERAQEIDAFVRDALVRYSIPGAAVAVIQDGVIAHTAGFGVLGADDGRAVTTHTRFMVGSITKSMTSLMMASLADQGTLDWEAKVTSVLPGFALSDPAATPQIRVRDLVNHSSGVARYDTPLEIESFQPTALIDSLKEIPMVAAPGQVFGYSNQMYAAGGYAAAYLAGAAYQDDELSAGYDRLMQQRVFDRIGMQQTTLDFEAALADSKHAWPNGYDPEQDRVAAVPIGFERFTGSVAPAGAAWSDVTDMARYAVAQLTGLSPDGQRVVSARNLEQTHSANIAAGDGFGYALGWVVQDDYLGMPALWHDGGTVGFTSNLLLLPEQGLAVVVLTNRAGAEPFYKSVQQFAVETLLGREHASDADAVAAEQDERASLRQVAEQTSAPGRSAIEAYLGSYEHHARATYSDQGFALQGDFGPIPLRASSTPGAFISGGIVTGMLLALFDTSNTPPLLLGAPDETGLGQVLALGRDAAGSVLP